jgi:hypothetical protein
VIADYDIRIPEHIDQAAMLRLRDVDVQVVIDGSATLLRGRLDQAALHGLLERIRLLGLPLQEVRRVRTRHPDRASAEPRRDDPA